MLDCGRRWGKSTLLTEKVIEPALEGYPVAWFAPNYKYLTETWRQLVRTLEPITRRVSLSEHSIELVTGGLVDVWGLHEPDVARGRKYKRIAVDEAALIKYLEEAWGYTILPTLVDLEGDAWFGSTPKGKDYFYKLYQRGQPGPDKRDGWKSWQMPTHTNPHLPREAIKNMAREMTARAYKQEIEADFIDSIEGALWTYALIEGHRVTTHPTLTKIVIAIDPAVTSGENSDETGIVVVGKGDDKHYYVLGDYTMRDTPTRWITKAVDLYHSLEANEIIAEVNNGGDLIRDLLKKIDPTIPYRGVHASRGKVTRAEPVSLLYEQGLVHHVGTHRHLEDEMTQWVPGDKSPNRIDALVWGIQALKREGVYL